MKMHTLLRLTSFLVSLFSRCSMDMEVVKQQSIVTNTSSRCYRKTRILHNRNTRRHSRIPSSRLTSSSSLQQAKKLQKKQEKKKLSQVLVDFKVKIMHSKQAAQPMSAQLLQHMFIAQTLVTQGQLLARKVKPQNFQRITNLIYLTKEREQQQQVIQQKMVEQMELQRLVGQSGIGSISLTLLHQKRWQSLHSQR